MAIHSRATLAQLFFASLILVQNAASAGTVDAVVRDAARGDWSVAETMLERLQDAKAGGVLSSDDAVRLRKLLHLKAQRHELQANKRADAAAWDATGPTFVMTQVDSIAADCTTALGLKGDAPARIVLDQKGGTHDVAWLRWQAPAAGSFLLLSHSQDTDPTLSLYTDCGDAKRLAFNDDADGLNARLGFNADYAGQVFYVRLRNLGDAGTVEVKTSTARRISGRVIEAGTQLPLQRLTITAESTNGSYAGTGQTDSDGRYTISILDYHPAGTSFRVRTQNDHFEGPSHIHQAWNGMECTNSNSYAFESCGQPTSITLAESEVRDGIDFVLRPGLEIAGRVIDARSGLPVAGAKVQIYKQAQKLREVNTDAAGRYRARALVAGTYVLTSGHPAYATLMHSGVSCGIYDCDLQAGTPFVLSEGTSGRADFALQPHAYIEVGLSLSDGRTARRPYFAGIAVLHTNGAFVVTTQVTQPNGKFLVGPLEPGRYLLRARYSAESFEQWYGGVDCASDCSAEQGQAVPIVIASGGDVARVSMILKPLPRLRGQVTRADDGQPLTGASVLLSRTSPDDHYGLWTQVKPDGSYEITDIQPANYFVRVAANRYIDQVGPGVDCENPRLLADCLGIQAVSLSLTSGDRQLDFVLKKGPTLSGRLLFEGEPLPPTSNFTSDFIRLIRPDRQAVISALSLARDGQYVLSDFVPSTYFAGASVPGYFSQLASDLNCRSNGGPNNLVNCPFDRARPIVFGTGDVQQDFDLKTWGAIPVRAIDARSGAALQGIAIDIWDSAGRRLGSAATNARGRAVVNLPGVSMLPILISTDNYAGYLDQVYGGPTCARGTSVYRGGCSLTGGQTLTLPNTNPDRAEIVFALGDGILIFRSTFD